MMIYTEQALVDELRTRCANVKKRIWIASPFIGEFQEICKIIDGVWMNPSIEFKVLTDAEAGFIKTSTLDEFQKSPNTEIYSLKSLHAKIYIVDDWCLLTSANLTKTAFSYRYEIGIEAKVEDVQNIFMNWWTIARPIEKVRHKQRENSNDLDKYQFGHGGFEKKWKLTSYTATDKFMADCKEFIEFAQLYERITGRCTKMKQMKMPLYLEVDYFFNYLYHDAEATPSKAYNKGKVRIMSSAYQKKEILKYFKEMIKSISEKRISERLNSVYIVQKFLNPQRIHSLSKHDIEIVLNQFHCLHSQPINITKILNNNTPQKIRRVWDKLLNNTPMITSQSVQEAKNAIYSFGNASVSELLAWYMPEEYPIMNENSKSGMRFFGIDIK